MAAIRPGTVRADKMQGRADLRPEQVAAPKGNMWSAIPVALLGMIVN